MAKAKSSPRSNLPASSAQPDRFAAPIDREPPPRQPFPGGAETSGTRLPRGKPLQRRRESEETYRLILEGIKDHAIFMLDPDGRIVAWNPGAECVLGYSSPEAIGRSFSLVFPPEDREAGAPEQELADARTRGGVTQEGWRLRKNGSRFWGSGTLTALSDASGRLRGFVKILRDNTQRKIGEEALQQAKLAAEAANEAKDQFLANVSHELRTPLAAIMLWTSLIEEQKITEPSQLAEALSAIRRSAEEQHKLIEDLVATARLAAGERRLDSPPAPVSAIARTAFAGQHLSPGA